MPNKRCDLFCRVVDNFGDIGVCWRLARQLAGEHGVAMRLWVDDLASFARLCPTLDSAAEQQWQQGVEIRHWQAEADFGAVPDLVIGAFACELPPRYVEAMAQRTPAPCWLNLEYLSAEDWVEGCHGLPSPHPQHPLTKHFFFPGFTPATGGLLLEDDLLEQRRAFETDAAARATYWHSLGLEAPQAGELRVSLFTYESPSLPGLLAHWAGGTRQVTCLVPEGRVVPQVAAFFAADATAAGTEWQRGNLRVRVLPFVEQREYDHLLWACDVNFVRGEDSCVRAQWAAHPFVWHIYPQQDGVHLDKLEALWRRYAADWKAEDAAALRALWQGWNRGEPVAVAWEAVADALPRLRTPAQTWADQLSGNRLALNLLDFCRRFD